MRHVLKWYIVLGEWALKLFILNLLWLVFSLLGIGILGVFPATVSIYTLLRQIIMGNKNVPIFKIFWNTYKNEFIKANLLGYTLSIIGFILYLDIRILSQLENNTINYSITIITYILTILYTITFFYIFPIYVHFNMWFLDYIKYSFILVLGKPMHTLLTVVGICLTVFIYIKIPGLIPVFGVSTFCFIIMKVSSFSLLIDKKV